MNKMLLFISFIFLLGCTESEIEKSNKIVLLQVDFMTNVFEGAKEQNFSSNISSSDTIPISIDYKAPGDFGSITLYYQPTSEMVFDGTIIWMGTGQIKYPENFISPEKFSKLETSIDLPDISKFQTIFYNLHNQSIDYASIWSSINKLEIVADYLKSNKKIGLFLYTPSVGVGDPYEWDWFVIMNK